MKSRLTLWLVFGVMAVTSLVRNEVLQGTTNVINWDGYGYYAYLPGLFIYGDISEYAFAESHFENYEISDGIYQLMETEQGDRFPIYNIGLAVVWSPAFLITHALVSVTGAAPADGMSYPYQLSVVLTSLLIIFLGLFYLRRFLSGFFSDLVVAISLFGVGLGTNLFYYLVEGPDMTHSYLFAGYAGFLYSYSRLLATDKWKHLLVCGLLAGLMCLIRSSEIVLFAIPALYGLRDQASLWLNFRRTLVIFGIALCLFGVQLLYYKIGTGAWFRDGYAGLGFDWLSPHLYEGLLGYRRGWLVYTPLMAFGLLGIFWLKRAWLLPILAFTLANCYLLFSWHIWWYGDTFGSRPVVQSYAILALPLAAFLTWVLGADAGAEKGNHKLKQRINRWRLLPVGCLLAVFTILNLFQHWQYNQRILPLDFVNKTYYWHVFGKTTLNPQDRVYLDTNEKKPEGEWSTTPLFQLDTLLHIPPKASREFTNLLDYRLTAEDLADELWLETSLHFSYYGETYDKWKFPSVVTEVKRGNEMNKWVQVKIPPVITRPTADSIRFAISVPAAQVGDQLRQYVWNLCQDSLVINTTSIDLTHRKE